MFCILHLFVNVNVLAALKSWKKSQNTIYSLELWQIHKNNRKMILFETYPLDLNLAH